MTGSAYINKILFGHSNSEVDAKYIESLLPFMLTTDFIEGRRCNSGASVPTHISLHQQKLPPPPPSPSPSSVSIIPFSFDAPVSHILPSSVNPIKPRFQLNKNSLFWAIYDVENPEDAFLGTKANAEINHRIKVINTLKKTPKRLKETNSKLTIEQTQALFGAMLTAKEDRLDFCIAYAAFYHKSIVVVYEKTYTVFSPTIEVDLSDDDNVIVLYASKPPHCNYIVYKSENNLSRNIINQIVETRVAGPLKSISNYKTTELDDIANKLQICTTQSNTDKQKEKRRKKEDIYNDIKVAIHKDAHG